MKRLVLIFAVLLAAAGAIAFGKPLYHRIMAKRLLHAAEAEDKAQNPGEARRLYSLALQKEPANLDTLHSCAAFLKRTHDPEAVLAFGRLCELQPKDDDALLDFAEAAIDFGGWRQALGLLAQRSRQPESKVQEQARFFNLLAICHLSAKNLELADEAYTNALKRAPGQPIVVINQARLRLFSTDTASKNAALETLVKAFEDPAQSSAVLPALLQYAARAESEPAQANAWLAKAESEIKEGASEIYPTYLGALKRWRAAQFPEKLESYLKISAATKEGTDAVQRWMTENDLDEEALAFRSTLPADEQNSEESLRGAATAMARLKRIEPLAKLLDDPGWEKMEAVALAWQEWIRRRQMADVSDLEKSNKEDVAWQAVLARAVHDPQQYSTLVDLTSRWQWQAELEKTLWAAADDNTNGLPIEALSELEIILRAKGDASGYLHVLDRQLERSPNDGVIANNAAYMGYLLNRETAKSDRISADLLERFPRSVDFLATSAFGRFQKGDIEGGLKLFEPVPKDMLLGTAPGMTYGWLLAAKGDREAFQYLKGAEQWTYFPEERRILGEARKKLTAE